MALLDADTVEYLLHSSSVDKGIERTMERFINELEIDSMYIIHYEEDFMEPEMDFEWDNTSDRHLCALDEYINRIENWYHFDESELFVARATQVLSQDERTMYKEHGYGAVVEYRMTNHGNVMGYIVIAWNRIRDLTEDELNEIHIIFKLMNDMLCKEYMSQVMGESEGSLFSMSCAMTKTSLFLIDEEYRIFYINAYARETYPNIKVGDNIFRSVWGEKEDLKESVLLQLESNDYVEASMYLPHLEGSYQICATKVRKTDNHFAYVLTMQKQAEMRMSNQREAQGKKFIFAMRDLYKDMIVVEIRKDRFFNLFTADIDNQQSYSMDFVLKWMSKVHIDDKQKFLECFDVNFLQNAYMNGERKKEIDFRYRTHEGQYHCMNGQILFEQNTNKDITAYILFQDIEQVRSIRIEEEKKMRESILAARSAAELKGQILANISHEIRTPMSGIISMSSVARQVYKDEKRLLECLENIDDYSEHMMQVMDELLEVVKVDNETIHISKQPFRLENFMNRVDVAMREKIEKKNMNFSTKIYCQYSQLVGDDIRLQQAVYYLINNAVSYTPLSGSISLTAKQVAVDKKTVYIRFILDDTGSGLTNEMKESIFGFASNTTGIIEGQHFDLSLAAKLIRLMGGQIGVEVNATGTHLNFTLPFEIQEGDRKKSSKKRIIPEAGNFNGKRILLAEDSEMGQDALRAVLEVVGFGVDTVENGKKAVIRFISQPAGTYDAILMDVHMPYMDGREATKCIRISGKEDGETIPIIGLMANTYEEDINESKNAGMQEHLGKPVDVNSLYRVLNHLLLDSEE